MSSRIYTCSCSCTSSPETHSTCALCAGPLHASTSRVSHVPRLGPHRARFLLQSVVALRTALRARGAELMMRVGAAEAVLPTLAAAAGARTVLAHSEVCTEERACEARLRGALAPRGISLDLRWGGATLHHVDDLPFRKPTRGAAAVPSSSSSSSSSSSASSSSQSSSALLSSVDTAAILSSSVAALPHVFTHFRKAVESSGHPVRSPVPTPLQLRPAPPLPAGDAEPGEPPSLVDIALADASALIASLPLGAARPPAPPPPHPSSDYEFVGGEAAAWERVRLWMHESPSRPLASYKATRNGLLGGEFSSRLSPWLAAGCISSRCVVAEVERFTATHGPSEGAGWLVFELLWRDYMRFYAPRPGSSLFAPDGPRGDGGASAWKTEPELVRAWALGATGWPLVDAAMRELLATGWMSNRARQVVASWLVRDAKVDWRVGAEWFERCVQLELPITSSLE